MAEIFTDFHPRPWIASQILSLSVASREKSKGCSAWRTRSYVSTYVTLLSFQLPVPSGTFTPIPGQSGVYSCLWVPLQKREKGADIYKTLEHAKRLPRDFPFIVSCNLRAGISSPLTDEKNRHIYLKPGHPSLLCALRHLLSQGLDAVSYASNSQICASSPGLHLGNATDISLSPYYLVCQQHLSAFTMASSLISMAPYCPPSLPASLRLVLCGSFLVWVCWRSELSDAFPVSSCTLSLVHHV